MKSKSLKAHRDKQRILDPADLRRWRTELPNLYDDADLDPYEFRLLAHYVRVGGCFETVRTTAKRCHMSAPVIVKKRRSLELKGFIKTEDGERSTISVEVCDRWQENFYKYSKIAETKRLQGAKAVQPGEQTVQRGEQSVHDVVPKKELLKNQPLKKEQGAGAGAPVPVAVQVFRSVRRSYPPRETWFSIAESVGDAPSDLEFWKHVLTAYAALGWNRQSVTGPLDWFKRRELPHISRGNGHSTRTGEGATDRSTGRTVAETFAKQRAAGVRFASDEPAAGPLGFSAEK